MSGRQRLESPCIRVCVLDDEDICVGCYRDLQEIVDWQDMEDDERLQVLAAAAARRRARGRVL